MNLVNQWDVRLWRHVRTGTVYERIVEGQLESEPQTSMVVYRSVEGGTTWIRPSTEFYDGRFVPADES